MARVFEIFMVVNAIAGIATFLGVRFVWRRSRHAAKRGFDVIHVDKEPCPICGEKLEEDEMFMHVYREHPEELEKGGQEWSARNASTSSEEKSAMPQLPSGSR